MFAILEGGAKQPVLVADTLLDALLPKMAVLYTSNKKQTRIESKGNRYEMGDFVVKLGSVTMSGSFKGILVEVRGAEVLHWLQKGSQKGVGGTGSGSIRPTSLNLVMISSRPFCSYETNIYLILGGRHLAVLLTLPPSLILCSFHPT